MTIASYRFLARSGREALCLAVVVGMGCGPSAVQESQSEHPTSPAPSRPPATPSISEPAPVPNGYTVLAALAKEVPKPPKPIEQLNLGELNAYVMTCQSLLDRLPEALAKESRVPWEFTQGYIEAHEGEIIEFKALRDLLFAQARLAEDAVKLDQAAHSYLRMVQLGQALSRGGVLIDRTLGTGIEETGLEGLRRLFPKLSSPPLRSVLDPLDRIEAAMEDPEVTLANQSYLERKTSGLVPGKTGAPEAAPPSTPLRAAESRFLARQGRHILAFRRLLVDLAMTLYKRQSGSAPENIRQLVPGFLSRLPVDPETGQPLPAGRN